MEDTPKEVEESTSRTEDSNGRGVVQLAPQQGSIYSSLQAMQEAETIAEALCKSDLVPDNYRKNVPNTMIALEMAQRIGTTPFMVMQNLDVINGKPSWRASFVISALNSCGRFSMLKFERNTKDPEGSELKRSDDRYGYRAVAKELETGDILKGPWITWTMVRGEGWDKRKGSKWQHMPELMFQYRAATLFGRLYAPDILNGMHSAEEQFDIVSGKKLTPEENERMKQEQRISDWIEKAKDIETLKQVEDAVNQSDNQQLVFEFENKLMDLSDGSKKKS